MEVLVVVDMQNDFIDGSLGTKEAVSIVPKVADKIKNFKGMVLATRDTHEENYLSTQEGTNLPVQHCIRDTRGWEMNDEAPLPKTGTALQKQTTTYRTPHRSLKVPKTKRRHPTGRSAPEAFYFRNCTIRPQAFPSP